MQCRTVFLIENDLAITEIISWILGEMNLDVIIGSHRNYIEGIKASNADLIILDYWLDNAFNGKISAQLKSDSATKDIPIILTSTLNNIHELGLKCKASDTLSKPFELDDLELKVRFCLKNSYLKKQLRPALDPPNRLTKTFLRGYRARSGCWNMAGTMRLL